MAELVFNEASAPADMSELDAGPLLVQVARASAELVSRNMADRVLRMSRPWTEVALSRGTLWDVLLAMLRNKTNLEEASFLMGMAQRAPLIEGLQHEFAGRFLSFCARPPNPARDPLVYCAVLEGVAVSLNSSSEWAASTIEVEFSEMLDDASLADRSQVVDNLSEVSHGVEYVERARVKRAAATTARMFWAIRADLCPNLRFGLDVQENLKGLDESTFRLVLTRLQELDATSKEWRRLGSALPKYSSHVSPESESTMKNPALKAGRVFRDADGAAQVFEWHARYGSGGRIHFIARAQAKSIEVGYIGPHLPL